MKHRQLLLCLMAFFLMLPSAGCGQNSVMSSLGFESRTPDSVEGLAMKGLDYYEHGKYLKAKDSFEMLLSRYPPRRKGPTNHRGLPANPPPASAAPINREHPQPPAPHCAPTSLPPPARLLAGPMRPSTFRRIFLAPGAQQANALKAPAASGKQGSVLPAQRKNSPVANKASCLKVLRQQSTLTKSNLSPTSPRPQRVLPPKWRLR